MSSPHLMKDFDGDNVTVFSNTEITALVGVGVGSTPPQSLGSVASAGSSTQISRVDHIHTHGDLSAAVGVMHSIAQFTALPKEAYYEGIPTPLSPNLIGNDEISNPGNSGPSGETAFGTGTFTNIDFSIRTAHTAGSGIEFLVVNLTTPGSVISGKIAAVGNAGPVSGTIALNAALPVTHGDKIIVAFLTPANRVDIGVGLPALIGSAAMTPGIPAAAIGTNGSGWRIVLY